MIKRDNNMITVCSDLFLLDWSVSGDEFQRHYDNSTWHSKLQILAVSDIIWVSDRLDLLSIMS